MTVLRFLLTPESASRIHDILICLAKFNETVFIEGSRDRLELSTLNSSKSSFASFSLDAKTFFSQYECCSDDSHTENRFTCSLLNKALISVFKAKINDSRSGDMAIDRCEVCLLDVPDQAECRLVIKMVCNQGLIKTYKLTYESVQVMHALFDKSIALNRWNVHSSLLKEYIEYFGAKTEQLDIYTDENRVVFTSFTEKITDGKEILKHPLQTVVSASTVDFNEYNAREKMHIIINVRDFKAIVTHADTLKTNINALYSQPMRPLKFSYSIKGILCEYTLMTAGNQQDVVANSSNSISCRPRPTSSANKKNPSSEMRPSPMPVARIPTQKRKQIGSAKTPISSQRVDPDSQPLFVPADEDRQWDPPELNLETLGWDVNGDNVESSSRFHSFQVDSKQNATSYVELEKPDRFPEDDAKDDGEAIPPTQRISQVSHWWIRIQHNCNAKFGKDRRTVLNRQACWIELGLCIICSGYCPNSCKRKGKHSNWMVNIAAFVMSGPFARGTHADNSFNAKLYCLETQL